MSNNPTALVTGATSGLGFEAAAQLADQGYGRVIMTARSDEKARAARDALTERTGKDVFETLTLDLGEQATVAAAARTLADEDAAIDLLLLNAGLAPAKDVVKTSDGLEATFASSLIGHHLLAMRLLEGGALSANAHIVIAGSEAARGDVPTFKPLDIDGFAAENFGGDLEAAIENQMRMEEPATYKPGDTYATAKLFVAWWAAELADRLPEGMTVNAVSPGSTPDTNATRSAPFFMRNIMLPFFKVMPGMSHSVADGASRYLEVATYGPGVNGEFFASKPKKMTGPIEAMQHDHLHNPEAQKALWNVTTKVAGGVGYPA